MKARNKAREVEAKANLHTIQIAVERYNTDHKEYPAYLLGGDKEGWKSWHKKNDEPFPEWEKPANKWVDDPFIAYDYLASYPQNPFVDATGGAHMIQETSFIEEPGPGDGDPRFGFNGNIMGMILDDPNFFEDAHPNLPYSRIETKRTLDRGKYDPTEHGYPDKNAHEWNMPGLYYNSGGRYNAEIGEDVITFWPGNFFYRSATEIIPQRGGFTIPFPNTNYKGYISRYMLGVWGAQDNKGRDVIRLQNVIPDSSQNPISWRSPHRSVTQWGVPVGIRGASLNPWAYRRYSAAATAWTARSGRLMLTQPL